jgi:hypothetical protein
MEMKVRTVDLEDAFDDLPFFGFHYEDLFYRGEYREELAKLGIYVPDLALDRRKPHNSINALVCVTGKYGSTYFSVRNNTGDAITNVTIKFTYDTSTILGSYGIQYADDISIPRLESGETVLVPYQFQAGSTAGRIIGKAIQVTYTSPNGQSQTAYTTNPIFIMCNAQPKIRSYSSSLPGIDLRRFIPFLELASFQSAFEGMYISRPDGSDPSITTTAINNWLSGSSSRWANIMHWDDSNGWYSETLQNNQILINKLDPSAEIGAKPMTLNETVSTTTLSTYSSSAMPSASYDLALQCSPATSYYVIGIKKASPWLALWYGRADVGSYFPNSTRDYALFAYVITVPLRRLGFYSAEYSA